MSGIYTALCNPSSLQHHAYPNPVVVAHLQPHPKQRRPRTPYSAASSASPRPHPSLHLSGPRNSSSAPRPAARSPFPLRRSRRRCSNWPKGRCSRSRTLCPAVAGTGPKAVEGAGGSRLRRDWRRRGWMRCAVVAAVLGGRMSRRGAVEVAAAEASVFDLAVVGFAVAPCRRPSSGVLFPGRSLSAFPGLSALPLRASA